MRPRWAARITAWSKHYLATRRPAAANRPPVDPLDRDSALDQLRAVETSPAFSWNSDGELSGIPDRRQLAWWLTGQDPATGWLYDHVPKTGGSEFAALCEHTLDPLDHLHVRWPGSWLGITLGRLTRATLVHGHGAALAAQILPRRRWHRALTLRQPLAVLMSAYQQDCRAQTDGGRPVPSLHAWVDEQMASAGELGLNFQTAWLSETRRPVPVHPYFIVESAGSPDDRLAAARSYLETSDLIAPTERVRELYLEICAEAEITPRWAPDELMRPIENTSRVPWGELARQLSPDVRARLDELTQLDQELYQRAQAHPNWLG